MRTAYERQLERRVTALHNRAKDAERRLAEAERLLGAWVDWMSGQNGPHPYWDAKEFLRNRAAE
jgi:hypothetical protein